MPDEDGDHLLHVNTTDIDLKRFANAPVHLVLSTQPPFHTAPLQPSQPSPIQLALPSTNLVGDHVPIYSSACAILGRQYTRILKVPGMNCTLTQPHEACPSSSILMKRVRAVDSAERFVQTVAQP